MAMECENKVPKGKQFQFSLLFCYLGPSEAVKSGQIDVIPLQTCWGCPLKVFMPIDSGNGAPEGQKLR